MRYLVIIWMLCFVSPLLAQSDMALAEPGGAILSPVSGCSLTGTENVTVRAFNFGSSLPAGTAFNVSYTINGGAPVTEMVVLGATLLSNSGFQYSFTTQADLSIPGVYAFAAAVFLAGDINPTNDSYSNYIVSNSAASVGGSVSSDQTICGATNSGSLSLSGQTGAITRWETSQDAGLTWRYVSQTTTQQHFLNLNTSTQYRAVVQNGLCPEALSSGATVTITCVLPLKWISFDASRAGNNVDLRWETADEINTSHFIIERHAANESFRSIGTVPAQSPSQHYSFTDHNPPPGELFYRVRQVDLDGRHSYSSTQSVEGLNESFSVLIRNNPVVSGILSFDIQSPAATNATIGIFNANGKMVISANKPLGPGITTIHLAIPAPASGIYWMRVESGNLSVKKKFMVMQ